MPEKFRLFRRTGGMYYAEDTETKKQSSLGTKDKKEALRLLQAKNEAQHQAHLNYQLAQAYLSGSDPMISSEQECLRLAWAFVAIYGFGAEIWNEMLMRLLHFGCDQKTFELKGSGAFDKAPSLLFCLPAISSPAEGLWVLFTPIFLSFRWLGLGSFAER